MVKKVGWSGGFVFILLNSSFIQKHVALGRQGFIFLILALGFLFKTLKK